MANIGYSVLGGASQAGSAMRSTSFDSDALCMPTVSPLLGAALNLSAETCDRLRGALETINGASDRIFGAQPPSAETSKAHGVGPGASGDLLSSLEIANSLSIELGRAAAQLASRLV